MIPEFEESGILPPYIGETGDERIKGHLSPYKCDTLELCIRFGTSKERVEILKKLILFRNKMNDENIQYGFQWLYGSFSENIEVTQNRSPEDLDLMTFYRGFTIEELEGLKKSFPDFFSYKKSKKKYALDHTSFFIGVSPEFTIDILSNSMQLCTHTRSGIWKGIVRIEINTPIKDKEALEYLETLY